MVMGSLISVLCKPIMCSLERTPFSFLVFPDIHPKAAPFPVQSMKQHPLETREEGKRHPSRQRAGEAQAKGLQEGAAVFKSPVFTLCITMLLFYYYY